MLLAHFICILVFFISLLVYSDYKGGENMDNKNIFAENLNMYMKLNNKTRKQICSDLGFSYYTFSDWVTGKKYPRMDKVERLATYFGIKKSDLIEEKKQSITDTEFANDLDTTFTTNRRILWTKITSGYLTDDEFDKLTEYLRFLMTQRKKD